VRSTAVRREYTAHRKPCQREGMSARRTQACRTSAPGPGCAMEHSDTSMKCPPSSVKDKWTGASAAAGLGPCQASPSQASSPFCRNSRGNHHAVPDSATSQMHTAHAHRDADDGGHTNQQSKAQETRAANAKAKRGPQTKRPTGKTTGGALCMGWTCREARQMRLNTREPLVPPKPKLFFRATSIFRSRAVLAQ
jgi:hypothetical protein